MFRALTELTIIVHLLFILFAVFGGFVARRWWWLTIVHMSAVAWAVPGLSECSETNTPPVPPVARMWPVLVRTRFAVVPMAAALSRTVLLSPPPPESNRPPDVHRAINPVARQSGLTSATKTSRPR